MEDKLEWNLFDPEETTTLAVPKGFAEKLRDEYKGANDMARLVNWAEKEFSYKDSITNEDLIDKLQELNEKLNDFERKRKDGYNNSISVEDFESVIERMTIDGRTGEVNLQ